MDFDAGLLRLRAMLTDSLTESLALRLEAETLRTGLESWQAQAESWQSKALKLSSELTASRAASEALSSLLTGSVRREALTQEAADNRARLDGEAVEQARSDRWLWAGGAALAGLALGVVLGFVF